MKRVHLENLSNLRSFSSGILVEWQSLENVVVNQCPNFWKFGLEMIKKSQLKSIFIQGNEGHIIDIDNNMVAYLFEFLVSSLSNLSNQTFKFNSQIHILHMNFKNTKVLLFYYMFTKLFF